MPSTVEIWLANSSHSNNFVRLTVMSPFVHFYGHKFDYSHVDWWHGACLIFACIGSTAAINGWSTTWKFLGVINCWSVVSPNHVEFRLLSAFLSLSVNVQLESELYSLCFRLLLGVFFWLLIVILYIHSALKHIQWSVDNISIIFQYTRHYFIKK